MNDNRGGNCTYLPLLFCTSLPEHIAHHSNIGLPGSVYGCGDDVGKGGNHQKNHYQKKSLYPTHFLPMDISFYRSYSRVHHVDIGPCMNIEMMNFQRFSRQSKRICNHPSIGLLGNFYVGDDVGKGGNRRQKNHYYQKKSLYPTHFLPLLGIDSCMSYSRFHHVDIGPCIDLMNFQRSSLCP